MVHISVGRKSRSDRLSGTAWNAITQHALWTSKHALMWKMYSLISFYSPCHDPRNCRNALLTMSPLTDRDVAMTCFPQSNWTSPFPQSFAVGINSGRKLPRWPSRAQGGSAHCGRATCVCPAAVHLPLCSQAPLGESPHHKEVSSISNHSGGPE